MTNNLNYYLNIKGKSGKNYKFELYSFERNDISKLCDMFTENESGVYVFLKIRRVFGINKYERIYCGESTELNERLHNHDREDDILRKGANCFGILFCKENETKDIEKDILLKHNFTCNKKNNC